MPSQYIPPVIRPRIEKLLDTEGRDISKSGKRIDRSKKFLSDLLGYGKKKDYIDKFTYAGALELENPLVYAHFRVMDKQSKDKFELVTNSKYPIELRDQILNLHIHNKEDRNELITNPIRIIIAGFIEIQNKLHTIPINNRPKYIVGISHLIPKISRILRKIGTNQFESFDPGGNKENYSANDRIKLKSSDKFSEGVDKIRRITIRTLERLFIEEGSSSLLNNGKKNIRKRSLERKMAKNYDLQDIQGMIIETEKFMKIDFSRLLR